MSSLVHQHLRSIFMLPSKLITKFQGWVYDYLRLLLGMACSVSCLFCVFTFIWYLAIRGLCGFLINFQFLQNAGCDNGDCENYLNIDYSEHQPGHQQHHRSEKISKCSSARRTPVIITLMPRLRNKNNDLSEVLLYNNSRTIYI